MPILSVHELFLISHVRHIVSITITVNLINQN